MADAVTLEADQGSVTVASLTERRLAELQAATRSLPPVGLRPFFATPADEDLWSRAVAGDVAAFGTL